MANYRWDPQGFGRAVVLPAAVTEQHLKLAGPTQLKVLLWFAANGCFDPAACAAAVGYSAADCVDAMQYWVCAGVLCADGESPATVPLAPPAAAPVAPARRPAAVKPQMTEVLEAQGANPQFAYLLDTVSARLGKPLSGGDMETLLYLFRTAGLPVEVILMAVEYAAQTERFTMRYIEKLALDWADKGLLTIAAAEEYLCYLERCQRALMTVQTVCAPEKPLRDTAANQATAEKWLHQWLVSEDLLREATRVCREQTGGFALPYVNRILENWYHQGITTVEQAQATQTKRSRSGRQTDGVTSDYEQMVEQYVPVYRKKKAKGGS